MLRKLSLLLEVKQRQWMTARTPRLCSFKNLNLSGHFNISQMC